MTPEQLEQLQLAFDASTQAFAKATAGMRELGRALANLGVALAPLAHPEWVQPDPGADRCSYRGCNRMRERERDRCFWHRREVHPGGPQGRCLSCGAEFREPRSPAPPAAGGSSEPGGDR